MVRNLIRSQRKSRDMRADRSFVTTAVGTFHGPASCASNYGDSGDKLLVIFQDSAGDDAATFIKSDVNYRFVFFSELLPEEEWNVAQVRQ
ncbi:hypothetical protein GCM10007173_09600 [Glutamicibacter ardleyensis]|uniref:Uncharacterized protein n=1 Tax=Glutamicibacter ardleyensis TaxID=225894 RepID=A0ABQ2DCC5_9MICC|nr:hypothetical protein GCM10007173_09600 [Glutamicibacter ardleyensis]